MFYAPAITLSSLVVCYRRHFHIQLLLLCRLGKSSLAFCLCFNFPFLVSSSHPLLPSLLQFAAFLFIRSASTQRHGPEKDDSVGDARRRRRLEGDGGERKFLRRLAGCVGELCFRDHCIEDAYTRLLAFLYELSEGRRGWGSSFFRCFFLFPSFFFIRREAGEWGASLMIWRDTQYFFHIKHFFHTLLSSLFMPEKFGNREWVESIGLAKDRSEHTKNVEPKTLLSCVPGFLQMCYKFFFCVVDRGVEFLPSNGTSRKKSSPETGLIWKHFFPSLDFVDESGGEAREEIN